MLESKTNKSYKNVSFFNDNGEKFATADCIDFIDEYYTIGTANYGIIAAYHVYTIIAFDIKKDDRCEFPTGKALVTAKDGNGNVICSDKFNVNFNRRDMNVVFSQK